MNTLHRLQAIIPPHLIEHAKAASLLPWGCVENRPMHVNYDVEMGEWYVSPLWADSHHDKDRTLTVATATRGNFSLRA